MKLSERLEQVEPLSVTGRVAQAVGIVIEASGPFTSVGEVCEITREGGHGAVMAEVVGFREDRVLLMPLGEMQGIGPGSRVVMKGHVASVSVGPQMLGRIFDGLGHPLDGLPPVRTDVQRSEERRVGKECRSRCRRCAPTSRFHCMRLR